MSVLAWTLQGDLDKHWSGFPAVNGCEIQFAPFRNLGMIRCPNVNTNKRYGFSRGFSGGAKRIRNHPQYQGNPDHDGHFGCDTMKTCLREVPPRALGVLPGWSFGPFPDLPGTFQGPAESDLRPACFALK